MGAIQNPLPAFREDMFEFGEKEVPLHANRKPVHNGNFWGLQGMIAPHIEGNTVLATNITDRATLILLSDARLKWLGSEFGMDVSGDEVQLLIPRDEVTPLYSHGKIADEEMAALIASGASTDQVFQRAESISGIAVPPIIDKVIKEGAGLRPVSLPVAEPVGRVASAGTGGEIVPVPIPQAA